MPPLTPDSDRSSDPAAPVDVTVLLPAWNEEQAIAPVIAGVRGAMARTGRPYEILVVDDASTDRTAEIARSCGARVLRRPENGGSGAARKTGIREARGEIIVMLDADGTYHADDIPRILECFPDWDQVNGARTSEQGTHRALRVPAKWLIRRLAVYLTGRPIPDLNTGFKAFKRSLMLRYLWAIPDGFSCVTSMTLAFLTNGHLVRWVPTTYHPRIGVSKFHPIRDTRKYIETVLRMVMYFRPLRVFLPLAAVLLLGGSIKAILSLRATGSLQESDIIIVTMAFLVAVLGLLADLIVTQRKAQ